MFSHVFESGRQATVSWQIDFVGVPPAPFFVVFGLLLFASLFPLAKRKSGWGICGSVVGVLLVFLFGGYFCLLNMEMMSLYKRL